MAVFTSFLGPTYTAPSVNVDGQRCVDLYPEIDEGQGGKTPFALYKRPGLTSAYGLGGAEVRGLFAQNSRCYAVVDGRFVELFPDGSSLSRGAVAWDHRPATICSNGTGGNQVMVTSGGLGYILNTSTNAFTQITATGFPANVTTCAYVDGYFLAFTTARFQTSTLEDGTAWDASDFGARSEGSDPIVTGVVDHRYVWILGELTSEIWYNAGSTFPFQPIPSIFIETGCAAADSATQFDGSIAWIAQSERGSTYAVQAYGPTANPTRISTHGVETAWNGYRTVSDAIGWAYEEEGHSFWVLYFPSADATWVYDAATKQWHERTYWSAGQYHAHLGRCHAYAFGKHLVGARNSGTVYQQALSLYDDSGSPIRWMRRSTHLCKEQIRAVHDRVQVDLETGVGLSSGQGSAPTIWARWSDDGGHVWSSEHQMAIGALGQYRYRAYLTRLGQTRDRVYEVAGSDPVKIALIGAYLSVRGGSS